MELQLKQQGTYAFDEVSMGEILLRLDPGEGRIKTARHFAAWEGGGEYNVARGLRKCFGMKTSVITAFTNNEVGRLLEDMVSQGGVDTSLIRWLDFDGIGRSSRNAINFTERGFGIRGAVGCSDRANTAVSHLGAQDYDFDYIFATRLVSFAMTSSSFVGMTRILTFELSFEISAIFPLGHFAFLSSSSSTPIYSRPSQACFLT